MIVLYFFYLEKEKRLLIILGNNVNIPYKLLYLRKMRHSWGLVCAVKGKKLLTCDPCPKGLEFSLGVKQT